MRSAEKGSGRGQDHHQTRKGRTPPLSTSLHFSVPLFATPLSSYAAAAPISLTSSLLSELVNELLLLAGCFQRLGHAPDRAFVGLLADTLPLEALELPAAQAAAAAAAQAGTEGQEGEVRTDGEGGGLGRERRGGEGEGEGGDAWPPVTVEKVWGASMVL